MKKNSILAFVFCVCVSLSASLRADTAADAYARGDYQATIELGEQEASAAALVLATRARLARIDLGLVKAVRREAKIAEKMARRAAVLDPKNTEAHVLTAAAIGYRARTMGRFKGFRKGLARKGKKEIMAALAIDNAAPWPHAVHGLWNLEIIRRGGNFGARMTGANSDEGRADCEAAARLSHNDPVIDMQCGVAMLALDEAAMQAPAMAALRRSAAAQRVTLAYDRAMIARAKTLVDIFDREGVDAARAQAVRYLEIGTS